MHTPLWAALAAGYPSLLTVTNGVRILCSVLAVMICAQWWGSVWRCVRDRAAEGDAHRAGWVPLAVAGLIFNARWFTPDLSDLARGRMALVAQFGVAFALGFAIYVHGHRAGALRLRRAMLVYGGMLALCIAVSACLK